MSSHKLIRRFSLLLLCALCLPLPRSVSAHSGHGVEETCRVRDGRVTFSFYEDVLSRHGITVTDVQQTADATSQPFQFKIEAPWCDLGSDRIGRAGNLDLTILNPSDHASGPSFDVTDGSDLTFVVRDGVLDPSGLIKGSIRLAGGITFASAGGGEWRMEDFALEYGREAGTEDNPSARLFLVRNDEKGSPAMFDLSSTMTVYMRKYDVLILGYNDIVVRNEWARAMNRPELAGAIIGVAEVQATTVPVTAQAEGEIRHAPSFDDGRGGVLDVSLGFLTSLSEVGRLGTYPNGVDAMTMATTSCNKGDVDVPWEAPMDEDHPGITMQIYREKNTGAYTQFEQIGYSDVKHGFFALSNSQCDPCQHPSDGTFLGVGCSDTYGGGNNADFSWLGPRHEWNPYAGTWECTGSHFSGEEPDCIRRHGSGGHLPTDHRLIAADADLDNLNSTYYYEAMYVVKDDAFRLNNIGSRRCTMSWDGLGWDFQTPEVNNQLVEGPAVLRWEADMHTWSQVGPDDGQIILSAKATDLGGGMHHYEYALFNFDSHRMIRSITFPTNMATQVTNIEFHDGDQDAGNEWQAILTDDDLTFETVTFEQDSLGNALWFNHMYNYRFDADAPPQTVSAELGVFRPGDPMAILVETTAPGTASSVDGAYVATRMVRLLPSRPNPISLPAAVRFELPDHGPVKLVVYDAGGRRVRTLVDGMVGSGAHSVVWDGSDSGGRRVGSGVYFYVLQAGRDKATESVVILQ